MQTACQWLSHGMTRPNRILIAPVPLCFQRLEDAPLPILTFGDIRQSIDQARFLSNACLNDAKAD
jgi:hypothetical protein